MSNIYSTAVSRLALSAGCNVRVLGPCTLWSEIRVALFCVCMFTLGLQSGLLEVSVKSDVSYTCP